MSRTARLGFAIAIVLLAASGAIIVRQGSRIQSLEFALASTRAEDTTSEGGTAMPLTGNGQDQIVDFGLARSKPTIIYVFRPSCVVCRHNGESLSSLVRQVGGRYNVIGISLDRDGLEEFVKQENIDFPVYTDIPREAIRSYHLVATPETIVVSNGKILKTWVGGYTGPAQVLIERFFSVKLPSLSGV